MVPQPPVKLYTPSIISTLKNSMQTVGPICKCLFGPSDSLSTAAMLREEIQREQHRLKNTWDFDVREALAPLEKRSKPAAVAEAPQSPKRRYVWERVEAKDVPSFYSKGVQSPRPAVEEPSTPKRRKVHDSVKSVVSTSPLRPLACRDENISPNSGSPQQTGTRKRVAPSSRLCVPLSFNNTASSNPSPVNFVENRTVPTTARAVSALRVPSTTNASIKSTPSTVSSSTTPERCPLSSSPRLHLTPTKKLSSPAKSTSKSSPRSSSTSSTQRLITDMLPLKKNRRPSLNKSLPQQEIVEERRSRQTSSA